MSNELLTHQKIAREAAKILTEESPFISNINRGRQDEFGQAIDGYKIGDTVKIEIPPTGEVFDGANFGGAVGGSATDVKPGSVTLTVDTQKHIALQFGSKEKKMDVASFSEKILRPQMQTLSSVIEADLLQKAIISVPNLVGTLGTTPTAMKTYAQARAKLQAYLAPPGDRSCIFSSDANVELVDASKALFHANAAIERGFLRGTIGEAQGAMFYESQNVPTLTNGSQVACLLVNGTVADGDTSMGIDGGTSTNTVKKGSVFTIANVYRVHPLTGTASSELQQFVVTEDLTLASGAGTLKFYPAVNSTAPNKTVSALPADNAALTFSGSASTGYSQGLMYQKGAFTAAFVPLAPVAGSTGYTARLPNGISVRVMTYGNGDADYERTRIDVLYGFQAVRPLHACRIPG
jgi:hypothetical protein